MRLLGVRERAEIDGEHLPAVLARDGAVLISHGSVGDTGTLLRRWTEPVNHPHQSVEGLTVITPRERSADAEAEAGFTWSALLPHTDRSLQAEPPSVLAAVMVSPARSGGATALVDGARVLVRLSRAFGDAALADLRLVPAGGRGARAVAESAAGLVRIRYRDDQVAGPHGSSEVVTELRRLIAEETVLLELAAGEGYVLHNHRFLHGRTAFSCSRHQVRFLARDGFSHPFAWLDRGFSVARS